MAETKFKKDMFSAAWGFASGLIKDPARTLDHTIDGVQQTFGDKDPARWWTVALAGTATAAFAAGIVMRNPALAAVGGFHLASVAGRFQDVGEKEEAKLASTAISSAGVGPWGPYVPGEPGIDDHDEVATAPAKEGPKPEPFI